MQNGHGRKFNNGLKDGHVLVNGQPIKSNYKCNFNDQIEITIPDPEILDVIPEEMNLDIYFEDARCFSC